MKKETSGRGIPFSGFMGTSRAHACDLHRSWFQGNFFILHFNMVTFDHMIVTAVKEISSQRTNWYLYLTNIHFLFLEINALQVTINLPLVLTLCH